MKLYLKNSENLFDNILFELLFIMHASNNIMNKILIRYLVINVAKFAIICN